MNKIQDISNRAIFVYDLEFIGDINNLQTCRIWDMSFLCVDTKERFCTVVDPDPSLREIPPPAAKGLFPLTRNFLTEHEALPFEMVWPKVMEWIMKRSYGKYVILASHNNFSSDKIVLENHIKYSCCPIYFFDTLVFFRDALNTHDYSLKGLVRLLLNKNHDNAHRAETDTIRLYECLLAFNKPLNGYVYPFHYNSLRVIKGIGASIEDNLIKNGIYHVEQLLQNSFVLYNIFPRLKKSHMKRIQESMLNRLYLH